MVSYKKLWKLLIDRNMKKIDLMALAGISSATVQKLNKGKNVNTDVLVRICNALNCTSNDIMEIVPDKSEKWQNSKEKS
jgi:putative transcriptional regulator